MNSRYLLRTVWYGMEVKSAHTTTVPKGKSQKPPIEFFIFFLFFLTEVVCPSRHLFVGIHLLGENCDWAVHIGLVTRRSETRTPSPSSADCWAGLCNFFFSLQQPLTPPTNSWSVPPPPSTIHHQQVVTKLVGPALSSQPSTRRGESNRISCPLPSS